jgi:hypothetical protein
MKILLTLWSLACLFVPAAAANPLCSANPDCAELAGDCCPTLDGTFLDCCGTSTDQPAPAPVPTYTDPGSDYGTTITPTCIWPGVACTTDVVWIEISGQTLGTIPTEIGLLTDLGEFSY